MEGEAMTFATKHDPCDHPGGGDMLTKQSMADACDVNNILAQYQRTGVISHVNNAPPAFLDLPPVMDLQQAMTAMQDAEASFMALPAKVREEFSNDPVALLAAVQDPSQRARLIELGLIEAPPAPAQAPSAPPSPSASAGS